MYAGCIQQSLYAGYTYTTGTLRAHPDIRDSHTRIFQLRLRASIKIYCILPSSVSLKSPPSPTPPPPRCPQTTTIPLSLSLLCMPVTTTHVRYGTPGRRPRTQDTHVHRHIWHAHTHARMRTPAQTADMLTHAYTFALITYLHKCAHTCT